MSIGIYKITNPKGKVYIGQSVNIEDRWEKGHKYNIGSGKKLKHSFSKYGWKNHTHTILEECSIEDLTQRETYWIKYYDSFKKGLNSTNIGGIQGYKDVLWKQSHHKGMKGRKGYWEGKQRPKHSKWIKENGSGLSYERTQKYKDNISKIVSESWKNKNREEWGNNISKGKKGKGLKPIICIETQEVFPSITDCSEKMGISQGCLCSFVKGKYSSPNLKGYTFKYFTKDFDV